VAHVRASRPFLLFFFLSWESFRLHNYTVLNKGGNVPGCKFFVIVVFYVVFLALLASPLNASHTLFSATIHTDATDTALVSAVPELDLTYSLLISTAGDEFSTSASLWDSIIPPFAAAIAAAAPANRGAHLLPDAASSLLAGTFVFPANEAIIAQIAFDKKSQAFKFVSKSLGFAYHMLVDWQPHPLYGKLAFQFLWDPNSHPACLASELRAAEGTWISLSVHSKTAADLTIYGQAQTVLPLVLKRVSA
jgi:hypothetical protein